MGLQYQGEWLRQMGIDTRTEALQRRNPGEVEKLQRQRDRLAEDVQMGGNPVQGDGDLRATLAVWRGVRLRGNRAPALRV